jgi:hypothetical protein
MAIHTIRTIRFFPLVKMTDIPCITIQNVCQILPEDSLIQDKLVNYVQMIQLNVRQKPDIENSRIFQV